MNHRYVIHKLVPGQLRRAQSYYYNDERQATNTLKALNDGQPSSWPPMLEDIMADPLPIDRALWGISILKSPTMNEWGEDSL